MITQDPSCHGTGSSPTHHCLRRDSFLKYSRKAAHEYDDGADVLQDGRAISDQRPEFVRSEFRIALQVVQKRLFVGVVVRIALFHP